MEIMHAYACTIKFNGKKDTGQNYSHAANLSRMGISTENGFSLKATGQNPIETHGATCQYNITKNNIFCVKIYMTLFDDWRMY